MNDKTAVSAIAVLTRFVQQEPSEESLDVIKADLQAAFADDPNSDARLLHQSLDALLPVIREAGKRAYNVGFTHSQQFHEKLIADHNIEVAKVQMDGAERNQLQEQIIGLRAENSEMEKKLRKLDNLRVGLREFLS